jgi:hypothetical protein
MIKIFTGSAGSVEDEFNKWSVSDRPTVLMMTQSESVDQTGWGMTLTVYYK